MDGFCSCGVQAVKLTLDVIVKASIEPRGVKILPSLRKKGGDELLTPLMKSKFLYLVFEWLRELLYDLESTYLIIAELTETPLPCTENMA
jgi:hypothetical protein